jgi:hypothetical protein
MVPILEVRRVSTETEQKASRFKEAIVFVAAVPTIAKIIFDMFRRPENYTFNDDNSPDER